MKFSAKVDYLEKNFLQRTGSIQLLSYSFPCHLNSFRVGEHKTE